MYTVQPKKKESNVIVVTVDPFARRGRAVYGKAGRHSDKRRKAKVNQRSSFKRELE